MQLRNESQMDTSTHLWALCRAIFGMLPLLAVLWNQTAHSLALEMEDPTGGRETTLDLFKRFVASPPAIQSLDYQAVTSKGGTNPVPENENDALKSGTVKYFQGKWQPGCFLLRTGTHADSVFAPAATPDFISINLGDDYWTIHKNGFVSIWSEHASPGYKLALQPSQSFFYTRNEFAEVLNMGVMYVPVASIKWLGNQFHAAAYLPDVKMQLSVDGQLESDPLTRPKRMAIEYRGRTGSYRYVVHYYYDSTNAGPVLPDRVASSFVQGPTEFKMKEWRIFSLATSKTPLGRATFNPLPFISTNKSRLRYYTNQAWYVFDSAGRFVPLKQSETGIVKNLGKVNNPGTYRDAVMLLTLIGFALASRAIITQKHNKRTTNENTRILN